MKRIVRAPAKLNLGLDAPFVHPDGAIEWRMVMTSIGLSDHIQIETTDRHDNIRILSDSSFLPNDRRNLAYQAAHLFLNKVGIQTGLKISIKKNIPVAAGLGGGSSDAAAVLRALNEMFDAGLSFAELAQIGIQVDSDVPYCVYSRTALVSGRGEIVTPLQKLPKMWFVLAKPNISVSTPKILRQVATTQVSHPQIDELLAGIENSDYDRIVSNIGNSLEEITTASHPQIETLKSRLVEYGADGSQMSGSGPTVYGICRTESRAHRVYNSISGFCNEVYIAQPECDTNPVF
ncbi:4-(cytidine 5'-diphospho)-2-C-methyl-D-erythritol kinase [Lentilactobacillus otakiensis]|uniref:4-diphosphocytidyl-2-C-methyl-D-erythritol kinase n=1 Tax=Lentilactobacillus otakiensis DSM 19908 = JCM 15040 TaxID=1423780 RepID=S4NEW4_9LACO|nr:4-(cytidine 5'-diphospho)-2-C-methyl-D-erythritol kinase [Lentilactobacillus otakiensis]KRL11836.1 4-diphosphocytidyl-2-C-methyl-D-erythritol kinase [Lentilactobacillus otakiensis DSM 19908 = JCM 15040]MBZ3776043.1 4-(cytidine 5'-diphospho)-2-C-methyl-D-erythritol kinase [Lentilactobacillus otakiensis]MDV3519176.1 4-(cytidine 5'-diphospho)-2-C-methyl-D-erythritol kinase [Lentilactobacillus otakiensis]GAD17519.1 4-diphosphocytidyl-2-C-methyl-D-erythritol kinase [Lentilactobacillus otakiensis 